MNTKFLMLTSALLMGIAGILFTFLPQEILSLSGNSADYLNVLLLQVLGALYLAFAILNWMAKANIIGGIYSKPVALGNFTHFFIVAITLIKHVFIQQSVIMLWITALIYSVYAIAFAIVAFGNPIKKKVF